jgi:membrane associated rhomboid family serine protease
VVTAVRRAGRAGSPVVTYAIIAVCVLVFLAEAVTGVLTGPSVVEAQLGYFPPNTLIAPWQMVTSIFVHGGIVHILFNMFSLFVLGRQLEPMIGRLRFLLLFLLSGIGGSVAVLIIAPGIFVVGASGAIFGLLGAYFVIARHLGANATQLIVVIGINLALGFFIANVAWQAHVGGIVVGALVGLVYVRTRSIRRRGLQYLLLGGVLALLVLLTFVGLAVHGAFA